MKIGKMCVNTEKIFDSISGANTDMTLEEKVVELLSKNRLSVTTAESCTGGLVSATIVNAPGASEVLNGSYVTYSNEQKQKVLGVKESTLEKYGAVSEEVAIEMAKGALVAANADVAVSTTGIAGPGGGTYEKPVGLVYIGCAIKDKVYVEKHNFSGNRREVRENTTVAALTMILECLQKSL